MLAEARKQHRIYFHGAIIYFSMFLWPILDLVTAVYMFKPFTSDERNAQVLRSYLGDKSLEAYLLIGYLGYNIFFSLIQAAWRFTFERFQGTLELVLLTPASRFAIVLGNATAMLIESVWLLAVFSGAVYFLWLGGWDRVNFWLLGLGLIVMIVAAIAWGALLNSFFLLTRDVSLLYTILQEPLNFLSGVRFPIGLLTNWMQAISYALPLTYCLIILRKIALWGADLREIGWELVGLAILTGIMLAASYVLLGIAERHAKRTGTLTLF
jgi:ABC-2 type transport system permease protein